MIDKDKLTTALMNAVKPSYGVHADCPECRHKFVQDNGEWLLWCGMEDHAQVILDAARAWLAQQESGMEVCGHCGKDKSRHDNEWRCPAGMTGDKQNYSNKYKYRAHTNAGEGDDYL